MSTQLVRLTLDFPAELEDLVIGLLYLNVPWGWQDEGLVNGLRRLVVHFDQPEQSAATEAVLQEHCPGLRLGVDRVDNADWTSAWKKYFTPIHIGQRFVVLPSWMAGEARTAQPIVIEPKMAFGTGHHQTTALCLGALDHLAAEGRITPGQSFLDLGTGSGILAIGAAHLGLTGLGLDIDQVAMDNARENVALNQVEDKITLEAGSIEAVAPGQRFDCILANILANPLMDMAEAICAHLKDTGTLVLSGILMEQAEQVSAVYKAQGLDTPELVQAQDWALLVFRKQGPPHGP